ERIRRAGRQAQGSSGILNEQLDIGFRVFRVDSTNMSDVLRLPDETDQQALAGFVQSVKPGRSSEDLLFQVLIDWGLDLTLSINVEAIGGKTVWVVDEGALVACFDDDVTPELL